MTSFSTPSPQIILKIVRKSDGNAMFMNIPENANHKVSFIKGHVKESFCKRKRFHLYYHHKHIRSWHHLRHYGITSKVHNIEIIVA
ncbi:unnamed protein product [Adineta steineri]|uniref:Uncharacterized protein n=1 Tax=Adineta steineri TaxID=433720 RepID=A0A815C8H9_9BILA|nr:unnamed protein product [Adineta steineri]